jgi:hypothetical protein
MTHRQMVKMLDGQLSDALDEIERLQVALQMIVGETHFVPCIGACETNGSRTARIALLQKEPKP